MRASPLSFRAKARVLIVCTLALVLISINLARPVQTIYRYSANVVASEHRFAALETSSHPFDRPFIQLRPIKDLLNELPYQASISTAVPNLKVRAVDVYSTAKLTSTDLSNSLVSSSETEVNTDKEKQKEKDTRWNRWRISVLEHQIEVANQARHPEQADNQTSATEQQEVTPYRLVSVAKQTPRDDVLVSLQEELQTRQNLEAHNSQADMESRFAGNGIISLSTPWQIRIATGISHTGSLLACLALSVLLASIVAYVNNVPILALVARQNSANFARTMRRLQLPVMGVVGRQTRDNSTRQRTIVNEKWLYARTVCYAFCEWVLLLAMAICCARLLFDPLWRDLIIHSPIAALSSLVCLF
jgi:hypothetical protein